MYYNTKASGARIRELRLAKKLDQIELAELQNVSHGYISRIESGTNSNAGKSQPVQLFSKAGRPSA